MSQTQKVAVTGAAGTVGGYVIDLLRENDYSVIAIDRPGTLPEEGDHGYEVRMGDLTDRAFCESCLEGADHIIVLGPEGGEKGGEMLYEGPPERFLQENPGFFRTGVPTVRARNEDAPGLRLRDLRALGIEESRWSLPSQSDRYHPQCGTAAQLLIAVFPLALMSPL